jgi:hypothetical protein
VGERVLHVELRLQRLGPGWHVLHVTPLDVDHLLVGTPGIFAITIYDKRVSPFDRRRAGRPGMDHVLRIARHEARLISRRLTRLSGEPLSAWPVVVINDGTFDVTKAAGDAYVVAQPLLIPWLKSLMSVLDPETVAAAASHAGDPGTWALGA